MVVKVNCLFAFVFHVFKVSVRVYPSEKLKVRQEDVNGPEEKGTAVMMVCK